MIRVFLASPYAATMAYGVAENIAYARRCAADCFKRGEAPFLSHLLYTQPGILDDKIPAERHLGIQGGLEFLKVCDKLVVYVDRGISSGMKHELKAARELVNSREYYDYRIDAVEIQFRSLFGADVSLNEAAFAAGEYEPK